ncbi:hypothetical protein protein [Bacillus cereus G9241]|nr:hypothetical protein protein [Bacillus cereus G9241]
MEPADVPATRSHLYPFSANAQIAPTCAIPRTPPPSKTPSIFIHSTSFHIKNLKMAKKHVLYVLFYNSF